MQRYKITKKKYKIKDDTFLLNVFKQEPPQ